MRRDLPEAGATRPQKAHLPFPVAYTTETESRHNENGLPDAVLVDGVYVRAAYRAHLACSQPWALAVAIPLFHSTLAESQRSLQGLIARRRREQDYVRAPTPQIRHERAVVWRGALTVRRVQQQCARPPPWTWSFTLARPHQLEQLNTSSGFLCEWQGERPTWFRLATDTKEERSGCEIWAFLSCTGVCARTPVFVRNLSCGETIMY